MFKTLIATCLLTFSCSSGTLKRTQIERAIENTYQLHGAYVLRDNFEPYYTDFVDKYDVDYYEFSQNFATGENGYYKCLFYNYSNYYYGGFDTFRLSLDVNSGGCDVTLVLDMDDNGTGSSIEVPDEVSSNVSTLSSLFDYATNDNTVKYHILYINNYLRVTEVDYDIFSVFYTGVGNEYNTFYSGYYTFVNNWSNSFYWKVQLSTICDNQMHDMLSRKGDGNGLIAYSTYYEGNNYDTDIYDGTQYVLKNRTIFMSGMIPNWLYDKFNTLGNFGYVPQPVESYTFSEFFFSIMDAPLYYLWSLFNFKLFGMNLFIALTSMITLCIVLLVIKKII